MNKFISNMCETLALVSGNITVGGIFYPTNISPDFLKGWNLPGQIEITSYPPSNSLILCHTFKDFRSHVIEIGNAHKTTWQNDMSDFNVVTSERIIRPFSIGYW